MLIYKTKTPVRPSIVGTVSEETGIWDYVRQLPWESDHYKSTTKRTVCHIKKKITYNPNGNIYEEGYKDSRIAAFFHHLNPDWGIGLALNYESGGKIGTHRDSTGYGRLAHSISSCKFIFELAGIKYRIPANKVISFPTKVPHAAYHIGNHERLVLCCWEYTPK